MSNTLTVIIEHAGNNFSAYVADVDGITVSGDSIDDIKKSAVEAIDDFIGVCKEFGYEIPEVLQADYEISFETDVCSFLKIYEGIFTKAGLERLTGINQKQLCHSRNATIAFD